MNHACAFELIISKMTHGGGILPTLSSLHALCLCIAYIVLATLALPLTVQSDSW